MSKLWAVTSYFNPLAWRRRLENYRCFRKHLEAPLITVEWHPQGRFDLRPGDAEILVQVQGGDLMWQKERLLNLGFSQLPPEAEYVTWLDCDILFSTPDWPTRVAKALENCNAVQLFSEVRYLGSEQTRALVDAPSEATTFPARCEIGTHTMVSSAKMFRQTGTNIVANEERNPGLAWAARRSTIERLPLFDRAIIGSGDFFWMLGVLGISAGWFPMRVGECTYLETSSYPSWAETAHEVIGRRISSLDGMVAHLYHGEPERRNYRGRNRLFNDLSIDIDEDITMSDEGVWKFVSPEPAWIEFMHRYFAGRRDDE